MTRTCVGTSCFSILLLVASSASAQSYTITTIAGGTPPPIKPRTRAIAQQVASPNSVAVAANGVFYAASAHENRVYRVDREGTVSIAAGTGKAGFSGDGGPATAADLNSPVGLALDTTGNLFIVDGGNSRIRVVSAGGNIRTIAGNGGTAEYRNSSEGNLATSVSLDSPHAIAVDRSGNVFVGTHYAVQKISAAGTIRTVAGRSNPGDASPTAPYYLSYPNGIVVDAEGNLFISDQSNKSIRKVTPTGLVSTILDSSIVQSPQGVALDSAGNLYIADVGAIPQSPTSSISVPRIWKRTPDGKTSIVAGGTWGFSGDGTSAVAARIGRPSGIAAGPDGTLYIADAENDRVRKVTKSGVISTVLGNGTHDFSGDGGPATSAQISFPRGVALDSLGNLFIAGTSNARVRKITANGIISTIAGIRPRDPFDPGDTGDGGPATAAEISVGDVAVDTAGNVYIASSDRVRKIASDGIITTIAGPSVPVSVASRGGAPGISTRLYPSAIAVDAAGSLYIADGSNNRVLRVSADASMSIVAGTGIAGFSGDGGPASAAQLHNPRGLAVDAAGNVFVLDSDNSRVRKITTTGVINTVAGKQDFASLQDEVPATSSYLYIPTAIAVDRTGNLFIATDSSRVRMVTSDGIIHTVAGIGKIGFTGDGGPATAATLNYPAGLAADAAGNLFVADESNNRIRKLTPVRDSAR